MGQGSAYGRFVAGFCFYDIGYQAPDPTERRTPGAHHGFHPLVKSLETLLELLKGLKLGQRHLQLLVRRLHARFQLGQFFLPGSHLLF